MNFFKKVLLALDRRRIIKLPDKLFLELMYEKLIGKKLDLNNPKTFNEKLQWLKLYDRNPEYTKMVDKYLVKEYVSNTIGEEFVIPTLGIYNSFDEIDFDKLPNEFVIKCTHDSGSTIVCNNKKEFNIHEAKQKINRALKQNFFYQGREWPYKDAKPRIIIEKYMVDESKKELKDYKFFCFNGYPKFVQVDFGRFTNHERNIYDLEWNLLDFQIQFPNNPNNIIKRPKKLDKMLELSRKLSKNIPHVRVDFYSIDENIYFGEMTFYHGAGFEKFMPNEWNKKLGDMLELPKKREFVNEK